MKSESEQDGDDDNDSSEFEDDKGYESETYPLNPITKLDDTENIVNISNSIQVYHVFILISRKSRHQMLTGSIVSLIKSNEN